MSKIIVAPAASNGLIFLTPAYCEPLQVMREMPSVQIIEHPATDREPARREVLTTPATFTPETDAEIAARAAHCILPVGTRYLLLSPEDIPAEGTAEYDDLVIAVDSSPLVSLGRDAFAQAWIDAHDAIAEATKAQIAAAEIAAGEWNAAEREEWIAGTEK